MNSYLNQYLNHISLDARKQFAEYQALLKVSAENINLTTIVADEEVVIKHFYDSLLLSKAMDCTKELHVIDIGSGAGFPGIPLKIVYPALHMTLLEPIGKRCRFLEMVIAKLQLKHILVVNARAEDYIKEHRETFDIATARAVAALPILAELALPFVKVGGCFIAMKGSNYQEELMRGQHAFAQLGAKSGPVAVFQLPNQMGERALITAQKIVKTDPQYPRIYAKIKKQPLV